MAGLYKQVVLDNYENNFLHRMNEMRKQNVLCDVRFIIKGKEFPCHKIMLVNATLETEYFKTLFTSNFSESDSETIPLQDIEPEAMDEILTAIYTTKFCLHRSNAYHILRASHMLLLMEIFNAVASCIMQNTQIDFLIETCLFAQAAERMDLHLECIAAIASDLNNLSKTDSFHEKIPFELFKMILKHENVIKDKEALFHIIMRWSNQNESSQHEVLMLLNAANLKSGCLDALAMARLIVCSYKASSDETPTLTNQNENTKQISVFDQDQNLDDQIPKAGVFYNVYLNTIDVQSGAKGWATLQSKLESNNYKFINHQQSESSYRKVKKVGTKLYCFEYDEKSNTNSFSCFENGERTSLHLPWISTNNADTEYYDIETVDGVIYLITGRGEFWTYDCETNKWSNLLIQYPTTNSAYAYHYKPRHSIVPVSGTTHRTHPKLISCNGKLFVLGVCQREPFSMILNQKPYAQFLKTCLHKFTNPAVCCYDQKMVICGSDHDNLLHKTVLEYDIVAQSWRVLEEMNIGRSDHQLNHHNGFLYAIENKSMVPNEKYDIKLNKWTCIPSLPQRLNFTPGNLTLATGSVFGCNIG